jgi:hypothetical protein
MDTYTLNRAVKEASAHLDEVLDEMEKDDTLTEYVDLTKNGIVMLKTPDHMVCDIYISTPAQLKTSFEGVPPQILYCDEQYDSPMMDAVFWINGYLEGRATVVVLAGYLKTHTAH